MAEDLNERLEAEVSLLEAMYPEQIACKVKARELKYSSGQSSFTLRLPAGYLDSELPEVLSVNFGSQDGRSLLKDRILQCNPGEEILDSIIMAFNEIMEQCQVEQSSRTDASGISDTAEKNDTARATVIVWLHHLLNTNKRKQALAPSSPGVSGITKPGYPGVLVYSGLASGVKEHVDELRHLNWQAFSVRHESDEEWFFEHGNGVKELETVKEVVADIKPDRRELFMEAMRMK